LIARLRRSFFSDISTICARGGPEPVALLDVTGSGDTPMHVRVPNALLECLLSGCFVVYAFLYGDKAFGVLGFSAVGDWSDEGFHDWSPFFISIDMEFLDVIC
jgi:hypothetical protein